MGELARVPIITHSIVTDSLWITLEVLVSFNALGSSAHDRRSAGITNHCQPGLTGRRPPTGGGSSELKSADAFVVQLSGVWRRALNRSKCALPSGSHSPIGRLASAPRADSAPSGRSEGFRACLKARRVPFSDDERLSSPDRRIAQGQCAHCASLDCSDRPLFSRRCDNPPHQIWCLYRTKPTRFCPDDG
jgi:hypothetical protein